MDARARSEEVLRRAKGECQRIDGHWTCWPTDLDASPLTGVDDRDLELYKLASEHFRHDLTQFWNHSSFFALLQGALISVAVTSFGPQGEKQSPARFSSEQIGAVIAVVGLLFAVFWAMVAWRRSVLIQNWRQQVLHLDGRVNRHAMYQRVEPNVSTYWWYGPTKLTVALPFLVGAVWFALLSALVGTYLLLGVLACEVAAFALVVARSWVHTHRGASKRSETG